MAITGLQVSTVVLQTTLKRRPNKTPLDIGYALFDNQILSACTINEVYVTEMNKAVKHIDL